MQKDVVSILIVWFFFAPFFFTALLLFGIVAFRHLPTLFHSVRIKSLEHKGKAFPKRFIVVFREQQKEWNHTMQKEEKLLHVAYILYALAIGVLLLLAPLVFLLF